MDHGATLVTTPSTSSSFLSTPQQHPSAFMYPLQDSADLFSFDDLADPLNDQTYTTPNTIKAPSPLPDKINTAYEPPQSATLETATGSETAEPVEPSVQNELDDLFYDDVYDTPSDEGDWAARDSPFLTAEYAGTEYTVFQSFTGGSDSESEGPQSLGNRVLEGQEELFYAPLNGFLSAIKCALEIGDDRDIYMEVPQLELCFVEGRDDHNGMSLDYMTTMMHSLGRYSSDDGLDYHHLRIRIWDLPQHNRQLRHLEGLMAQVGINLDETDFEAQETKTEVLSESHADEDAEFIAPSNKLSIQKCETPATDVDVVPVTCHLTKNEEGEVWDESSQPTLSDESLIPPLHISMRLSATEDTDLIPYDENDDIDADIRLLHSPVSHPVPTTIPVLTDNQTNANLGGQSDESDCIEILGVPKAEFSELAEVTAISSDPLTSGIGTKRIGSDDGGGSVGDLNIPKKNQESLENDDTDVRPGKRLRA